MHKDKVLALAKGFRGRGKNCVRVARERLEKSLQYAYRDRRTKKRDMRSLWIQRINAGSKEYGVRGAPPPRATRDHTYPTLKPHTPLHGACHLLRKDIMHGWLRFVLSALTVSCCLLHKLSAFPPLRQRMKLVLKFCPLPARSYRTRSSCTGSSRRTYA